jgi:hypothetical protein
MKGPEADLLRIQHILDAIAEIETYLDAVDLPILKKQFSNL